MEPERKSQSLKKLVIPVGITLVVLVIIALVLFNLLDTPRQIFKIHTYVVSRIVDISGLNQWLVKGIVIIALIPLLWVLPHLYYGKHKGTARAIGLIYMGLFFLTMYSVSKNIYFAHSGKETLKWYALTPDGVKYYDSPGVDTIYGIPLKPVTPEVIKNLRLWENKSINLVDPNKGPLFNPITGEPQVWYYNYPDGTCEFYDKPGYHPVTGDPLKPITKEVYLEWKGKTKKNEEEKKPIAQPPTAKQPGITEREKSAKSEEEYKKTKELQATAKRLEPGKPERRLNEFKSLINPRIATSPDKPNVAVIIQSPQTEGGLSPESVFIGLLKTDKANIIEHYFKEDFKTKGYFGDIYAGNTELLKQSDALSKLDCIVIGKIDYVFKKGSQIDKDLVSCNIGFSYKVIDKKGGIIKSDSLKVVGPGFSEDAALERGLEILAEKYSDRIVQSVL